MPKRRDEEDLKTLWRRLLGDYIRNRQYGVVEALWTMGFLQAREGLLDAAQDNFTRAQRAQNFTKRLYSHGAFLLKHGGEQEARHALASALHSANEKTVGFQAGMRADLAFRFFEVGLYKDMLQTAEETKVMESELPAPSFEVAAAYLALGDVARGKILFDQAILRFGRHEKGKVLLDVLLSRKIAYDSVTALRSQHYVQ